MTILMVFEILLAQKWLSLVQKFSWKKGAEDNFLKIKHRLLVAIALDTLVF
jgi:hypothetical protein